MNDPESHLKAARLAAPSESLDRRLQDAFDAAVRETVSRTPRRMWRLIGAFAATGLAAMFLLIPQRPRQPRPETTPAAAAITYRIELPATLRPLLFESHASKRPAPQFSISVGTP